MRTRPVHALALLLVAGCASPDGDSQPPLPDPSHMDSAAVAEPAHATAAIAAGRGIYGDLSVADANAILETYSEQSVSAVEASLTRTVSMEAAPESDSKRVVTALRLKDGKLLVGRVISDDGDLVEFQFESEAGQKGSSKISYKGLHPESVADLMLARASDRDAGALIDVAEYAAREGMYDVARVSYLAAVEADPSVETIAEARLVALAEQVAAQELDRGRTAAGGGDDVRARRILRRIQREFAGMSAADDAAAAVAEIDARIAERQIDAKRQRQLAPIQKLYEESVDLTGKGLGQSGQPTTAIRTFLLARSKTTSARRKTDAATRNAERSGDAELAADLGHLGSKLDMQERDNEIQLGTSYLDKGDYSKALSAAKAALAIDRQDEEALALVTRINEAQEEARYDNYEDYYNGYWRSGRGVGWYRWRRHRPTPYPRGWYPGRGRGWGGIHQGGVRGGGAFRGGGGINSGGGVRVGGAIRR